MFVPTADCSVTRRRFLVMIGATLAASLGVSACSQIERTTYEVIPESPDGLGALAKRKGIVYGANIGEGTFSRYGFAALAEKELAGLAPVGSLEFGCKQPRRRGMPLDFSFVDLLAAFAKARGMEFRVRPFFWWYCTPSWFKELDKAQAERAYVEFIRSVIGHYKGQAASYDASFESIDEDGYGMRYHEYMRKFGERHLDLLRTKWTQLVDSYIPNMVSSTTIRSINVVDGHFSNFLIDSCREGCRLMLWEYRDTCKLGQSLAKGVCALFSAKLHVWDWRSTLLNWTAAISARQRRLAIRR